MARPWPWQARGSDHASCVTLSGSRCLGGIHPTALQVVVRHGRRRKGAGAWDLSYGFRVLLLPEAEEGTKEEDDAGGPLISQRGVNNGVARGRLRGVAVAATAGGVDGHAGVGDAQLTRGPKWQRQLVGLGARVAAVAWACLLGLCACAGLAGPSGWLRGPLLLFLSLFFISLPFV